MNWLIKVIQGLATLAALTCTVLFFIDKNWAAFAAGMVAFIFCILDFFVD